MRRKFLTNGIDRAPNPLESLSGLIPRFHLLIAQRPSLEILGKKPLQRHAIKSRRASGANPHERNNTRISFPVINRLANTTAA